DTDFSKDGEGFIAHQSLGWAAMIGTSLEKEMHRHLNRNFTIEVDFQEKWVEIRVLLKNGVLFISLPQRRLFSSSSYIFLLWVFSVSLILLIIAILFMRNQIRPIRRLALSAERFGKGLYDADLKVEGAKEVRQAGKAFLDMKTRIKRQIEQRTDMLAGVSHDLRTPLTRLKLQLAMLGDSPDIDAMKLDVSDMEKMIEGYLNFVRGEDQESFEDVNFITLIEEIVTASKRQGCEINYSNEIGSLMMKIKTMAIKRALNNVISNAEKYAEKIWITVLLTSNKRVRVIIEDNGPSIPEDKYEKVFRPFYRIDGSRNLLTGGVGLGLPITMDIIHSHGGEIWLDQSPKGGLMVNIELPI
ncbi:MAG: ATP-binding protein, partial [Alphaproteobacteria bacterium]|nr:ATP-binding protein [Alphaproteobacteria bacterium]